MAIKETVREFILANFYVADAASLDDASSLLDLGVIDSTGVMEVVDFLEEKFQIRVEDDELLPDNLDSIARIASFVARKRPEIAASSQ